MPGIRAKAKLTVILEGREPFEVEIDPVDFLSNGAGKIAGHISLTIEGNAWVKDPTGFSEERIRQIATDANPASIRAAEQHCAEPEQEINEELLDACKGLLTAGNRKDFSVEENRREFDLAIARARNAIQRAEAAKKTRRGGGKSGGPEGGA